MKRNALTTAVLAGLTGVAGLVGTASAVNVNPDGLGQVLIYPYYTARGGNDTLISVVNTTSDAKAVKVRFLEAMNSTEVLDFNLYLSPFDVWTAGVTTIEQDDAPGSSGARLITYDNSCTVPYFFGNSTDAAGNTIGEQEFQTFALGDLDPTDNIDIEGDGGPVDMARTASGYLEMIEMAVITDETEDSATALTHIESTGAPADCQQLVDAWTEILQAGANDPDNYWIVDPAVDTDPPAGGLFGGGSIVDVAQGTMFTYNATAIDNFRTAQIHTNPGFVDPSLLDAQGSSTVFVSGQTLPTTSSWATAGGDSLQGILAVNAILTHDTIMNEYVVAGDASARSEWVVTFPTKRPHVQGVTPIAPFTDIWDGGTDTFDPATDTLPFLDDLIACEPGVLRIWDREEGPFAEDPETDIRPPVVSPRPPTPTEPEDPPFQLCWEANVIRFTNLEDDIPGQTEILGARLANGTPYAGYTNFDTGGITEGWARMTFNQTSLADDAGRVYTGLPVVGFWVNTFELGAAFGDGVKSNYGGSFDHRATRVISAPTAQ